MKKLLKKKVNVFGKGIPVFAIVILGLALVSAALIPYWGIITGSVVVNQGLFLDEKAWDTPIGYSESLTSLDAKMITSGHYLDNQADVDAIVYLKTTCVGGDDSCAGVPISTDTIGLSTKWSTEADAFANASMAGGVVTLIADKFSNVDWSSSEARITINAEDVGVTTLNDLLTMSWSVDVVSGYIAHVDVLIDTTGDGKADDALVFEFDKILDGCGTGLNYPNGAIDTFGDNGIVDGDAYAWLSSGAAGNCQGDAGYIVETLANWKSSNGDNKVLRFEIEVDGWNQPGTGAVAESHISNIMINAISVEIATLPTPVVVEGKSGLAFYVNSDFPKMLVPGEYTITTIVDDTA